MRSETYLSFWSDFRKFLPLLLIGVLICLYEFRNDGTWLLAPILTLIGYGAFTTFWYHQVKKIKAGKFVDKYESVIKSNRKQVLNIVFAIVLMIGMLGFALYLLTQLNSAVDTSMTGNNSTHNCIEASTILYSDKTGIPMPIPANIVTNAKKAWSRDSCDYVMLTDDFSNHCEGSIGLVYYGMDSNGYGQWYCANVPKDQLVVKH